MISIVNFLRSVIPYLPTLVVVYAVVKLLSSGLSVVAKAISTIALCAMGYWAFMYLISIF